MREEGVRTKCPCLYSATVPICRADTEAMRIPPSEHLNAICLGGQHRRCELFRGFLGNLSAQPGKWPGAAAESVSSPPAKRREDESQGET